MLVLGLGACIKDPLGSGSKGPLSIQELVSHEGYSTVALVDLDRDNDDERMSDVRPYCTGVWVDDTHFITAEHCVKFIQSRVQERRDAWEKKQSQGDDDLCELFNGLS